MMNRMQTIKTKKRWICVAVMTLLCLLLAGRIYLVNKNARLPEIHASEPNGGLEYDGIMYTLESAKLQDYSTFFENNEELQQYDMSQFQKGEALFLFVEVKLEIIGEVNEIRCDYPLTFKNYCNFADPFLIVAMNESLQGEGFLSGDTIVFPYVIFSGNLKEEDWQTVLDGTMEYSMVMGTYPVRNELRITDVEWVGEEDL